MSKITDVLKKVWNDAKAAYQKEPVRINGYITGLILAAGAPVAIAGIPVATVVAVVLGAVVFTEGTRASVFAPKTVEKVAAEAAKPKRKRATRRKKAKPKR